MASNPQVTVRVGANAVGFHTTMAAVEKRLSGLVGVASGLKRSMLEALGGFSVGAIVNYMAEYAKNLVDASRAMHITVQEAFSLKVASRDVGLEWEKWPDILGKVRQFRQHLFDRSDVADMRIAARLGLSPKMSELDILTKTLAGKGTVSDLSRMVGQGENAQRISDKRGRFLDALTGGGTSIDVEAVRKMADFKNQLIDLEEELRIRTIPVLARFGDMLVSVLRFLDKMVGANAAYLGGISGTSQHPGTTIALSYLTAGFSLSKEQKAAGEKAVADFWVEENKMIASLDAARSARKTNFEKEQRDMTQPQQLSHVLNAQLGPLHENQFLKMGGLFGIDINYRLTRLQVDANQYLKSIDEGIKILTGQNQGQFAGGEISLLGAVK